MHCKLSPSATAGAVLAAAVLSALPGRVLAQAASASADAGPTETLVVFGRGTTLVGAAESASEGSISGADMLVRPMLRTAEMLEVVPGMVAVQHSGSGKANQYFLRGFNLDHGTDFAAIVDGMPMNFRSHGHGQGYLDLNGLLPETIERVDFRKGTYRADVGDFAMAGAAFFRTIDRLDETFIALEGGEYAWQRFAGGGTYDLDSGASWTTIGEFKSYDGPWRLEEGLEHVSIWSKYLTETDFGSLAFTISGYEGDWHPTEQIPERVIGSSICPDAYCELDAYGTGDTSRWIGTAVLDGSDWTASAYIQSYDWHMTSDPTYEAQINQFDKRTTIGGRYDSNIISKAGFELDWGAELRHDEIGPVGLDEFDVGQLVANISDNDITETSYGVFAEARFIPTDDLRIMLGVRGDYFDFDATANQPGTINDDSPGTVSGSNSDSRVSPKLGLAYTLTNDIELYANWGKGFHSNDARGVVNSADPIPGLSPGEGYEIGARFEVGDFIFTATQWWLDQDSELIFVGDSNSVEPKGGSEREGYELTMFWRPVDWLGIDFTYVESEAFFAIDEGEGRYVDGALEAAGQFGVSAKRNNWEASMRARYQGPYALTPDNSQRAAGNTGINFRGAYSFEKVQVYAELLNAFDDDSKDIVYWYEAYVPGFDNLPANGGYASIDDIDCDVLNCRVSRAREPRTLRVGLKYRF